MMGFTGNHTYPIGVYMGDDALTMVQMVDDKNAIRLLASDSIEYPEAIKLGSASWQIWAIEVIVKSVTHGRFQGKKAIAAMPAREVFIDIIKMPRVPECELQNAIYDYLKPKLGLAPDNILMEYFKTDSENILVMAADKTKLYRHLAIYEKAHLKVASISVWPLAVLKAYSRLWVTHKGENDNPVMLLDIGKSYTNIVLCNSTKLYFAHSAPVGAKNLETDRMVDLLNSEMDMCRAKFRSLYKSPPVDHIIFISGHAVDKDFYTRIAKRARMSAQIGDCIDTVKATRPDPAGLTNHAPYATWMTAMGLSLS
jgi:Tfp pilus assembly PilM family ATPase